MSQDVRDGTVRTENKVLGGHTVEDGRNDCVLVINGIKAVIITQEFIEYSGISQEVAKNATQAIGEMFVSLANAITPKVTP